MRNPITLLWASIFVAACTTPAEQATSMQREMDRMIVVYGPACAKLGFPAGSDQWRSCVLQLSAKDDARTYAAYPYYTPYYPYLGPHRGPYY